MTDHNTDAVNDTCMSEMNFISQINDAIDELHIADDLIELVFMAACSEKQEALSRGSLTAQSHLQTAMTALKTITAAWREQASNVRDPKGVVA